jgi:3-deoxy-D-manno-octulosonic-acid transferase
MVFFAYRILIQLARVLLAPFMRLHPKLKEMQDGWKQTRRQLEEFQADPARPLWWFHCASLGEFEQAVPVMEALRSDIPGVRIAVSFFSPSGYRIRKNTPLADLVFYLPPDTAANNRFLLQQLKPAAVVWVKYEFWFGYLRSFRQKGIPYFLLSATFRSGHFLTRYPGKSLFPEVAGFTHIFTQDEASAARLRSNGASKVTATGDTRFDRVAATLEKATRIPEAEAFRQEDLLIIAGSSWPEEETLLAAYLKEHGVSGLKLLIVPHDISADHVNNICTQFAIWDVKRWSEYQAGETGVHVLVVDSIGLLSSLYQYGHVAVIGGGYGTAGLHNILEAAAFGMPIVCGPNTGKFWEAEAGRKAGFVFQPADEKAFTETLDQLIQQEDFRLQSARSAAEFCRQRRGATALSCELMRSSVQG